ncbi:cytochrome c [Dyadobacter sp. NIV53]|uniref:c-type cytochrome n=1 Tax=Dyadobacter sp. NIV53 TaxID=2861765 RepID=UPI001E398E00|nr:cytochrome c [Dyadobacter sp. NIV53]
MKSPYHEEPLTLAQGEDLFSLYCASCHGDTGYGDGAAGGALGQKPANFHDTLVTKQSNGALFWKLSNGKGNMPPFQDVFTAEQRWQLIAYVRQLGKTD